MSRTDPELRPITAWEAEAGLEALAVFIGHGGQTLGLFVVDPLPACSLAPDARARGRQHTAPAGQRPLSEVR